MIIRSIEMRGVGPIKDKKIEFGMTNVIVGDHGTGKTFLMRLLSGLTGTDETARLLTGIEHEYVCLEVEDEEGIKTFTSTGTFDLDEVLKFKKLLQYRSNFPITEWGIGFVAKCDPLATDRQHLRSFFDAVWGQDVQKNFFFRNSNEVIAIHMGDGFKRGMYLKLFDSPDGWPLLIEYPERSLHLTAKRIICRILGRANRQLIYTSHDVECILVHTEESVISM